MDDIKKSLITYYKNKFLFNKFYPKITSIKFDDDNSDLKECKVFINGDQFIYCVLGRFDKSTNFWEWGWSYERIKNKTYAIREFLNYALDNYNEDYETIRQMLINSKFKIDEKINLDIILAVSSRLILSDGYSFIYEMKDSNNITKYIILKNLK
jgi:hypothetical protein